MIHLLLLLAFSGQAQSSEALTHLQAGLTADKQHQLDDAIAEFRKATELDPSLADAFASLGQAYLEKREYSSAIAPLKHALELKPDLIPAHRLLGYALLVEGYAAEAIPHLARAEETAALGIAEGETGQLKESVTHLQAALEQHPNDVDLLYYLGRSSGLLSKQAMDTLVTAYPDSVRAHQAMAENYFVLRQMPQAEREFLAALKLRPDTPELHLELGNVYAKSSQWEKAEAEFRAQTKMQPGNAEAAYRLGSALLQQGKAHEAREELIRADHLRAEMPEVLYALAKGTGGFVIFNTNDFLAGLNKIANELDQYYILGYVPPSQAHDGSYHKIDVKVTRKGVQLRHRNGYYDLKAPDLLAGKPEGKTLEALAASSQPGQVPVSLSAPYFYTSPGVARVNVSLQVPASAIDFEKEKKELHSDVQVLGIACREDGSVAARFSDTVKVDVEKKGLKEFSKGPFNYQHTFNVAPGKYALKLVLSTGGQKFGKYETALNIAPFDGQHLELSGPALSNSFRPVDQLVASLDAQLLEDQTPLLFQGKEVFIQPGNRFQRGDKVLFYVEVFEPLMQSSMVPRIGVLFNIYDRKTNQQVYSSNTILIDNLAHAGTPLIPVAYPIPTDNLQAGEYRLEVRARNSAGGASPIRTTDFVVE